MLAWDAIDKRVTRVDYPPLPAPCAYGQAVLIGSVIYFAGGQRASALSTATKNFWSLDLGREGEALRWEVREPWPGPARAFNITAAQHNGTDDCVYVLSGRRQRGDEVEFLKDVWEFNPSTDTWRERASLPRCVMAGTGIGYGKNQILVLGGADGSLFAKSNEFRDRHPGFPKEALAYQTLTDTWKSAGGMPMNHVTTVPVLWYDRIIIASGEIRPRVRSPNLWSIGPPAASQD